jgi:PilZ domain
MANNLVRDDLPQTAPKNASAPKKRKERRLGARFAVVINAEIEDLSNERRLPAQTSDISIHGCFLDTLTPHSPGTRIRVHLHRGNETFQSLGLVVYTHEGLGMGIAFQETDAGQQKLLQEWIGQVNGTNEPQDSRKASVESKKG